MYTQGAVDALLEARDVVREYPGGVRALDGVSLQVRRRETLALVGESGSGKTTLLRLFHLLDRPTGGSILYEGRPLEERDPIEHRRNLGYVPQEGGLLPHWTVERNIGLVPRLLGWDPEKRRARARELLGLVGLDPERHAGRHPKELSGGQRQRVAVARALAADPELILLDEPFGALDALTRRQVQKEFAHLKERLGRTMVLVTHDLEEAFRLGDRVAVLKEGRLLQIGEPETLRDAPAHEDVARLLELAPL